MFARDLQPPYYATIFTSRIADDRGYQEAAEEMARLSAAEAGFLGMESARGADGLGITVCYWKSEADIARWRANAAHQLARKDGNERFYEHYEARIARVERAYHGPADRATVDRKGANDD